MTATRCTPAGTTAQRGGERRLDAAGRGREDEEPSASAPAATAAATSPGVDSPQIFTKIMAQSAVTVLPRKRAPASSSSAASRPGSGARMSAVPTSATR